MEKLHEVTLMIDMSNEQNTFFVLFICQNHQLSIIVVKSVGCFVRCFQSILCQ